MVELAIPREQASLRARVREFVTEEVETVVLPGDGLAAAPDQLTRRFHEWGFARELVEAGEDRFLADACVAAEELAYCSAAVASLLVLPVFFNRLAVSNLAEPARSEFRARLFAGPTVTAFAASEQDAGSDSTAIRTRAERSGPAYVLRGRKDYSSNVRQADQVIVVARTGGDGGRDGLSWFLVPTRSPGVEVGPRWDTLGLRSMDLSPITFDDVIVDGANLLGREGDGLRMLAESLSQSRTGIAAVGVGIARRARDEVLRFAKHRSLYGERLYKLQDYRFRIAEMERDIEAARALVAVSAKRHGQGQPATKNASVAKLFAGDMAMRITSAAVLMLGAQAYAGRNVVERLFRDARHVAIVEGSEPIHKELIFASVLRHGGC